MPPKENNYVIQKIPLAERPIAPEPAFPRQPMLYLELIENKKRIKPELVNKDYEPPRGITMETTQHTPEWRPPRYAASNASSPVSSVSGPSPAPSVASEAASETSEGPRSNRDRLFKKGTPYAEKYSAPTGPTGIEKPSRLPTLSELEGQNKVQRQKEFIDIDKLKHEDDNTKRELLFKLDILRKSYPQATIEKFTIHDKLSMIQEYYDSKMRMLGLENSVDNYKQYLTFLFMGMEALLGKVFKLDMKGFTEQQLMNMNKYERLLIELGQKNYMPDSKKFPVELRLLFLVIIQTAFFVVGKMILGGAASKILGAVTDMRAGGAPGMRPGGVAPGMRKMRGPRINLDELPG